MNKLHLGCGDIIKHGWINHDIVKLEGVDIVHDLSNYPWPWPDSYFDEIYAKDLLEHLPDTIRTMEEMYRISKHGTKIYIAVPYWNSFESITDPTHVTQFNEYTFEFFDPTKWRCQKRPYYTFARFRIERIGLWVTIFKPILSFPIISRYRIFYNLIAKFILRCLATYFSNIITGLEIYWVYASYYVTNSGK